ncbi:hypothetical protein GPL06_21205 [Bacteroides salyersiae]|nr:hypothetical protein [Bacteroides salyersiae]QUT76701.1 hypothetical protein INE81_03185 [Bacteroides salyersiae]
MGTLLCLYNCYTHLKNKYFTGIKKGYLSQTANLFVNLKSNTMKNTLQIYVLYYRIANNRIVNHCIII